MGIITPNKKYQIKDIDETKRQLVKITPQFIEFLKRVREKSGMNKIRLVGIGNSISAGWTNFSNDITPFVSRYKEIVMPEIVKTDIDFDIFSYIQADNNTNQNILDLINSNPSLDDILHLYEKAVLEWKKNLGDTIVGMDVDPEIAFANFERGEERFQNSYGTDTFTITHLNCCTGLMMKWISNTQGINLVTGFIKGDALKQFKVELENLNKILIVLSSLSEKNFITVGNIPYICTDLLKCANILLGSLNKKIEANVLKHNNTIYFDENIIPFLNRKNHLHPSIRIDFHPPIDIQYRTLLKYIKTLINLENEKSFQKVFLP